jgi:hypothetical protein
MNRNSLLTLLLFLSLAGNLVLQPILAQDFILVPDSTYSNDLVLQFDDFANINLTTLEYSNDSIIFYPVTDYYVSGQQVVLLDFLQHGENIVYFRAQDYQGNYVYSYQLSDLQDIQEVDYFTQELGDPIDFTEDTDGFSMNPVMPTTNTSEGYLVGTSTGSAPYRGIVKYDVNITGSQYFDIEICLKPILFETTMVLRLTEINYGVNGSYTWGFATGGAEDIDFVNDTWTTLRTRMKPTSNDWDHSRNWFKNQMTVFSLVFYRGNDTSTYNYQIGEQIYVDYIKLTGYNSTLGDFDLGQGDGYVANATEGVQLETHGESENVSIKLLLDQSVPVFDSLTCAFNVTDTSDFDYVFLVLTDNNSRQLFLSNETLVADLIDYSFEITPNYLNNIVEIEFGIGSTVSANHDDIIIEVQNLTLNNDPTITYQILTDYKLLEEPNPFRESEVALMNHMATILIICVVIFGSAVTVAFANKMRF